MEKAPKALLFHVTGAYPRTHRWVDLPGKVEAREAVEIAERLLTAITPKLPQENEREKTDSEEKVDDE